MRVHKRRKTSRFRGSHTHGRGFKKKARGSGHRGGVGMAGTGKRADQKKSLVINLYGNDYFKRDKALRRGEAVPKLKSINLQYIEDNIASLIKKGIAKDNKRDYEINLEEYKILGEGEVNNKLVIKAAAASKSAIEKVKSSGGEIILSTLFKETSSSNKEKSK